MGLREIPRIKIDETVKPLLKFAYQKSAMKADHQGMLLISRLQVSRHQDIDADAVVIDDFVASAVDLEGGELVWIQGCG